MQAKKQNLEELRSKINNIDEKIKELLEKRKLIVSEIGKVKAEKNLKIVNQKREKKILAKIKDSYIQNIFRTIIQESRKLQSFDQDAQK